MLVENGEKEKDEEDGGTYFLADYGDAGDARGCHRCFYGCSVAVELVGAWVGVVDPSTRWRGANYAKTRGCE